MARLVKHRHSVSQRFTLAMVGVVTLIIVSFAVTLSVQRSRTYEADLRTRLSIAVEIAQISLPTPLWYYNYEFLEDFLQALLVDATFVCADIRVRAETVAHQCRPDAADSDWAVLTQAPAYLIHATDIHYDGEPLGVIRVAASRASLRQEILLNIASTIALAAVLVLAIALTSMLVTRHYINRPLERVTQIAALISNGELTERLLTLSRTRAAKDELGILIRQFQRMILYLQSMATLAARISLGEVQHEAAPRTADDVLGLAFQRMMTYLNQIGQAAVQIAQGDLRSQIEVRSPNDLIGNAFTRMTTGLIALIADLRRGVQQLSTISSRIVQASSRNAAALEHVGASAFETSVAAQHVNQRSEDIRQHAESLNTAVEQTSAFIAETLASMTQVAENSRNLAHFADDMTATMAEVMGALEHVSNQAEQSKTLSETARQDALSGQASVEHVTTNIQAIADVTAQITAMISRLEGHSRAITTVLDVINDVADQTSLLALNASIIAAQAGAHGRGFVVVAEEIKGLAQRVSSSTKEIAQLVSVVQRDSAEAVRMIHRGQAEVETGVTSAHQAGDALRAIGRSADNAAAVATEIAAFVQQQTASHAGTSMSIRSVASMITQITRAIQEQERQTAQLATIVEHIRGLETQVLDATREQQSESQRVTTLMEAVIELVMDHQQTVHESTALANELAAQAELFAHHVGRFRLPDRDDADQVAE
jgi:methyl-accepting chemotaxis protein